MDQSRSVLLKNFTHGKRGTCICVVLLGVVIGSTLLAYTAFGKDEHRESRVEQVFILSRHGDRTPTETYPLDPHIDYPWENGWGALTKTGMMQLYNLGLWIRDSYGHLAGEIYNSKDVLIQSSDSDRCIMSTQALLAGLYKPDKREYFVAGFPWRPVPVHSTPKPYDKLILVGGCPKLDKELAKAYEITKLEDSKLESYFKKLSMVTGAPMENITSVEFLYNTLEIEELKGLHLPEWTKDYYNKEMYDIAMRSYAIFTSNEVQKKLRGGPLLKQITSFMINKEQNKKHKKMYIYGVHDITLINVLRTIGFDKDLKKPGYGASLIFEAYTLPENGDLIVKVKYMNNWNESEPQVLKVPGCEELCPLAKLYELWKNVIPQNWDEECKL